MRKIRLARGVWINSIALLLSGAGGLAGIAASRGLIQTVGWAGVACSILLICWGITVDDEHWWKTRKGRVVSRISLADALRRMGHGTQWSLETELVGPRDWPKYATREILDALSRGEVEAWGLWRPTFGTPNLAVTKIASTEWPNLAPEIRLNISRRISIANRISASDKDAGLYHEITLDRERVEELWPRWTLLSRIKRFIHPVANRSFAEEFGDIFKWRADNKFLSPKSEYYWNEPS